MPAPITWVPIADRQANTRTGPHRMTGRMKRIPWPYCVQCGLIALKNDETRRALRRSCRWLDDA